MTIEELAAALWQEADKAIDEGKLPGPHEHYTALAKVALSLIAAELAEVARNRARQWDASKNEYSDYRSIEADIIALAIEAHARKMGEA